MAFLERLRDELAPGLELEQPVTIEVSGITDVDVAGLQLLLSFLVSREDRPQTQMAGAGPVFNRALELTGMKEHYARFMV